MTWSERSVLLLTPEQERQCEWYVALFGTVIVRRLPDGTGEVLDPRTVRMVPEPAPDVTEGNHAPD